MDPDTEVFFNFSPFCCQYKSGRVVRFMGTDTVPASTDAQTGVISKDIIIDTDSGVFVRLYLPKLTKPADATHKLPVLFYCHGGGFVTGSAARPSTHDYVNRLVAEGNMIGVSVNYRLAPEHPLPIAYDDLWAALKWVLSHSDDDGNGTEPWLSEFADFSRLFLLGISAGGNIIHNVAARAAAEGLPAAVTIKGMIITHPYFLGDKAAKDPDIVAKTEAPWFFVCPGTSGFDDLHANPFADDGASAAALPCERVLVCLAELDELRDKGMWYYERLKTCGYCGEVELVVSEGEDHGFHMNKPECDKAVELQACTLAFIRK